MREAVGQIYASAPKHPPRYSGRTRRSAPAASSSNCFTQRGWSLGMTTKKIGGLCFDTHSVWQWLQCPTITSYRLSPSGLANSSFICPSWTDETEPPQVLPRTRAIVSGRLCVCVLLQGERVGEDGPADSRSLNFPATKIAHPETGI